MDKPRVSTFGGGAAHEAAASMGIYEAEGLEIERETAKTSVSCAGVDPDRFVDDRFYQLAIESWDR